jgi:hypothetical protein
VTGWTGLSGERQGRLGRELVCVLLCGWQHGDSESSCQALAGLNYQFRKFDASFGYRYLTWNNDGQIEGLTIKGPYAGVRFMF